MLIESNKNTRTLRKLYSVNKMTQQKVLDFVSPTLNQAYERIRIKKTYYNLITINTARGLSNKKTHGQYLYLSDISMQEISFSRSCHVYIYSMEYPEIRQSAYKWRRFAIAKNNGELPQVFPPIDYVIVWVYMCMCVTLRYYVYVLEYMP